MNLARFFEKYDVESEEVKIHKNGDQFITTGEGHAVDQVMAGIERLHYGLNRTDSGSRGVVLVSEELPKALADLEVGQTVELPGFNGRLQNFMRKR